jgi:chemotaxis protein CheD
MEIAVGMGEIKVAEPPHRLMALGMGSCIAVTLYDEDARIGGLAHIMLPYIKEAHNKSNPTRFADVGIAMIIDEMAGRGAQTQNMWAKIFGGANMFPGIISADSTMDIGKRNILAVRKELENHSIKIIAEEVGDHVGRTILFDTRDGSALVKTIQLGEREY